MGRERLFTIRKSLSGIVRMADREPIWRCSALPKGRVALLFRWSELPEDVTEAIEISLDLVAKGGAQEAGMVPFAAVFDETGLPHPEVYGDRLVLAKEIIEGVADEFLVWDEKRSSIVRNQTEGEWRPKTFRKALGTWKWEPCPRPVPPKPAQPEPATERVDAAAAVTEAELKKLERRAKQDRDFRAMARVMTYYFERGNYAAVDGFDYLPFLRGTREENLIVVRLSGLARLKLGVHGAMGAVKTLWDTVKATGAEMAQLLAEAQALVGPNPSDEARRVLEAMRKRPDPEDDVFRAPVVVNSAKPREFVLWEQPLFYEARTFRSDGSVENDGREAYLTRLHHADFRTQLHKGRPLAVQWPRFVEMSSGEYKGRTKLLDEVANRLHAKVCSPRLIDFFRQHHLKNVEFLSVRIMKDRTVLASDYGIVHPIYPQDALDRNASQPRYNLINPLQIDEVGTIVLDQSRLDPEVRVFRLARYHYKVLIEMSLAEAVVKAGFVGPRFFPL